jgi:hypothetical protein
MLDPNSDDCICKDQIGLNGNIDIYENNEKINDWIQQIEEFINKK